MSREAESTGPGQGSADGPESRIQLRVPEKPRTVEVFGVMYSHVKTRDGGDLWVTEYGRPFLEYLMPERWHEGGWYAKEGRRLEGTSSVYRFPTKKMEPTDRSIDLVVKWSRVGQDVPLTMEPEVQRMMGIEGVAAPKFNSPFSEFGLMMELRSSSRGNSKIRVLTQRPYAIYAPPERLAAWQHGRSESAFGYEETSMAKDQRGKASEDTVRLELDMSYATLYGWVKGDDASRVSRGFGLGEKDMRDLTESVIHDLSDKGFRVLDIKPAHFIVRAGERGVLRDRRGKVAYALIDFELLERTPEYEKERRGQMHQLYLDLQTKEVARPAWEYPPNLKPMRVFDIDYVCGPTESTGGHLMVVGKDPGLFDFFRPERWLDVMPRKLTERVHDVETRDGVHMLWAYSRVGRIPRGATHEKEAEAYGFNSPLESFSLAVRMRKVGMLIRYPRAVYIHPADNDEKVEDGRRYETHKGILGPDGLPLLRPDRRYVIIYGYWGGVEQTRNIDAGRGIALEVKHAYQRGLLDEGEYSTLVEDVRDRLVERGIDSGHLSGSNMLLTLKPDLSALQRTPTGELDMTVAIDASKLMQCGYYGEREYEDVIEGHRVKLAKAGFEDLNLQGAHILVSLTADGTMRRDANGGCETAHCNFALVRRKPNP